MIIKRIDKDHALGFNVDTDSSYVFAVEDPQETPLLTFDSDAACQDSEGQIVARLKLDAQQCWYTQNDLGITTKPVSIDKVEGIFEVEAEFARKWLALQAP